MEPVEQARAGFGERMQPLYQTRKMHVQITKPFIDEPRDSESPEQYFFENSVDSNVWLEFSQNPQMVSLLGQSAIDAEKEFLAGKLREGLLTTFFQKDQLIDKLWVLKTPDIVPLVLIYGHEFSMRSPISNPEQSKLFEMLSTLSEDEIQSLKAGKFPEAGELVEQILANPELIDYLDMPFFLGEHRSDPQGIAFAEAYAKMVLDLGSASSSDYHNPDYRHLIFQTFLSYHHPELDSDFSKLIYLDLKFLQSVYSRTGDIPEDFAFKLRKAIQDEDGHRASRGGNVGEKEWNFENTDPDSEFSEGLKKLSAAMAKDSEPLQLMLMPSVLSYFARHPSEVETILNFPKVNKRLWSLLTEEAGGNEVDEVLSVIFNSDDFAKKGEALEKAISDKLIELTAPGGPLFTARRKIIKDIAEDGDVDKKNKTNRDDIFPKSPILEAIIYLF